MKKLYIFIIIFVLLFIHSSCDHSDPEVKVINDKYDLITLNGGVALIKYGEDLEDDQIIINKNFISYLLADDNLILCEQLKDDSQKFWSFDLKTEELTEYTNYNQLNEHVNLENLEWEPLWVKKVEIQK